MRTPNSKNMIFGMTFIAASMISASVAAQTPRVEPDGSWITLSGTIQEPQLDTFVLDYGDGSIIVEMDDWAPDADAAALLDGDNVTVYGTVDQNLFTDTTIEASSVYLEGLGTYFYASGMDEEAFHTFDLTPTVPVVVGAISYTGTVSSVNDGNFTVNTGDLSVKVDTSSLEKNDHQKVQKGDLVTVSSSLGAQSFEDRELEATSVVILKDESKEGSADAAETSSTDKAIHTSAYKKTYPAEKDIGETSQ